MNQLSVLTFPRISPIAAYAIGLVMAKLLALALQPLITRWLTPTEFGHYAILITAANLLSLLMLMGMVDVLYRFNREHQHRFDDLFASAWTISIIISAGIAIPVLLYPQMIITLLPGELSTFSVRCLIASLALSSTCALKLAQLRIEDRAMRFMLIQLTFAFIQAAGIVILTPHYGVDGLMLAGLIAQLIQCVLLWGKGHRLVWPVDINHLRYGTNIALSGVLGFVAFGAERWVIGFSISAEELAVYSIAMQWALAGIMLLEPFGMWWFPRRYNQLTTKQQQQQTADTSLFGCHLAAIVCALLITFGCPFLRIWLPDAYHQASELLPFVAWILLMKYASTQLNIGCYYQNSAHQVLLISAASAVVALVALFTLIPWAGLTGALLAGALVQLFRFTAFFICSQRKLYLPYSWEQSRYFIILLLAISGSSYAEQVMHVPLRYCLPTMVILLLAMCLMAYRQWCLLYVPRESE
ncbi:lipopolysaccharide biosynthesis protein [Thaumasiovibrio sp. DFM-14]|uniref:lipopolysaccharide biosynthesis protein n=1 Tax=Thaumasiovibrio sp. DFM-14 TaxID=3384792 RepID=UPI0039A2E2D0